MVKPTLRGVSFEENSGDPGKFFLNLHALVEIPSHLWYMDDLDSNFNELQFRTGIYSAAEFVEALASLCESPIPFCFALLQRYPLGASIGKIDSYEDFVASACDFLLLFYDEGYYQLYAKDEVLIRRIYDFCRERAFENVEFITDENDGRTRMYF